MSKKYNEWVESLNEFDKKRFNDFQQEYGALNKEGLLKVAYEAVVKEVLLTHMSNNMQSVIRAQNNFISQLVLLLKKNNITDSNTIDLVKKYDEERKRIESQASQIISKGISEAALEATKYTITSNTSKAGKVRSDNDPRQREKGTVKECWEAWQSKPNSYKGKTAFASAMIDKFRPDDPSEESKHLSSVKKITDWCRVWEREK